MKYGIYYAYWEKEWSNHFALYIEKCKKLGFDILEIGCGAFDKLDDNFFVNLGKKAKENGIVLTGGYGPRKEHNMASANNKELEKTFMFYEDMFRKMQIAGIEKIGGALYSYWPVDYTNTPNKKQDFQNSVENMKNLADIAAKYNVTLNMEVLNRFEGYLLNEVSEAVTYVKAVDKPNVKVMLDTFHMNIEEDSITDAIYIAGNLLGHLHIGEANRRCPAPGGRIDWEGIGKALKDIHYKGDIVMEPFVCDGGQVGKDVYLWRDLSNGATESMLDETAAESLKYIQKIIN